MLSSSWGASSAYRYRILRNGKPRREAEVVDSTVPHPSIAVFAYDFPHRKTHDFILRMLIEGVRPRVVIAAPRICLPEIRPPIRVKPRHEPVPHPLQMCQRFDIPYFVCPHNDPRTIEIVESFNIELGVISGARILRKRIIQALGLGILNVHPGLLPQVRGLDCLQWSIMQSQPFGVTAHLIDENIDAGTIVASRPIDEYADDSLVDISLRLEEAQVELLIRAIGSIREERCSKPTPAPQFPANGRFPVGLYDEMLDKFRVRKKQDRA